MKHKLYPSSRRSAKNQDLLNYLGYNVWQLCIRIFGLSLIFFGLFSFTSLIFYDSDNFSWNTIGFLETSPPLGITASIIADILYQSFGYPCWLIPLFITIWGSHLFWYKSLLHFKRKLVCIFSGILLICFSFSKATGSYNAFGKSLLTLFNNGLWSFGVLKSEPWLFYTAASLSFLSGLFLYSYSLGISYDTWRKIFSFILRTFFYLLRTTYRFLKKAFNRNKNETFDTVDYSSFSQGELEYEDSYEEEEEELETTPIVKKSIFRKNTPKLKAPSFNKISRKPSFYLPSEKLIQEPPKKKNKQISDQELQERAKMLQDTLEEFGIRGEITDVNPGPVVTLYEFKPAPGVKTSRIIALSDDIARSMSALSTRVSVVPGKNAMGIEMPNEERETVFFRPLLSSDVYKNSNAQLPLILGRDIGGTPMVADLARMPHLLVAGTTGSGKSVAINTMILSLIYYLSPEQCKFIMVDPKMLELSVYEGIPHLLTPVVTDPKKAVVALKWAVREMEDRYQRMSKIGVRNIQGYNQKVQQAKDKGEEITRRVQTGYDPETGNPIFEQQPLDMSPLPYIVVIVDEMADLMLVAGKEIEATIQRLAQMARAAGIHLIMATQRPSVDVITGTIKANFPTRISFQVSSKIDSRTILSEPGAEQLLGQGDMLFMAGGGRIQRIHGPFVSDDNIEKVVTYLKDQQEPDYIEEVTKDEAGDEASMGNDSNNTRDPLFDQVVALCLQEKKASTSFIQRHFQIGYNRAARIMDQLEEERIVSPPNHAGRREILK